MGSEYYEDEAVLDEQIVSSGHDDFDDDDDFSDTDVLDDDAFSNTQVFKAEDKVDDLIGESSVVFDVEDLVAEFESEASAGGASSSRLRKRLEAIAERKRRHADLMDFADYDIDA